jgi:MFS family permease
VLLTCASLLIYNRQWQITQYHAQQAIVGNIFMIGACGLVVVMFANYFGRLPVALLWQALALGTAAWSAAATTFPSYMAARIVNGFFCSVGQGGALMWIKDVRNRAHTSPQSPC